MCPAEFKLSFSVALHCSENTYFTRVVFGARHFEKTLVQGQVVPYRVLKGETDEREREREREREEEKQDKGIVLVS